MILKENSKQNKLPCKIITKDDWPAIQKIIEKVQDTIKISGTHMENNLLLKQKAHNNFCQVVEKRNLWKTSKNLLVRLACKPLINDFSGYVMSITMDGVGNCDEYAHLVMYFILINFPEANVEMVSLNGYDKEGNSGDHIVVLVNRDIGCPIDSPVYWPLNIFIIDAWSQSHNLYFAKKWPKFLKNYYRDEQKQENSLIDPDFSFGQQEIETYDEYRYEERLHSYHFRQLNKPFYINIFIKKTRVVFKRINQSINNTKVKLKPLLCMNKHVSYDIIKKQLETLTNIEKKMAQWVRNNPFIDPNQQPICYYFEFIFNTKQFLHEIIDDAYDIIANLNSLDDIYRIRRALSSLHVMISFIKNINFEDNLKKENNNDSDDLKESKIDDIADDCKIPKDQRSQSAPPIVSCYSRNVIKSVFFEHTSNNHSGTVSVVAKNNDGNHKMVTVEQNDNGGNHEYSPELSYN